MVTESEAKMRVALDLSFVPRERKDGVVSLLSSMLGCLYL